MARGGQTRRLEASCTMSVVVFNSWPVLSTDVRTCGSIPHSIGKALWQSPAELPVSTHSLHDNTTTALPATFCYVDPTHRVQHSALLLFLPHSRLNSVAEPAMRIPPPPSTSPPCSDLPTPFLFLQSTCNQSQDRRSRASQSHKVPHDPPPQSKNVEICQSDGSRKRISVPPRRASHTRAYPRAPRG